MLDPPKLNWVERLQIVVAHPTLVYLLLVFGITGVMSEIAHPGSWLPGIIGLLCRILAFFAMRVLPINYVGLALMVLGIVLVILGVQVHCVGILSCERATSISATRGALP
jgi:membrane-bound serine protease (ClpP class)